MSNKIEKVAINVREVLTDVIYVNQIYHRYGGERCGFSTSAFYALKDTILYNLIKKHFVSCELVGFNYIVGKDDQKRYLAKFKVSYDDVDCYIHQEINSSSKICRFMSITTDKVCEFENVEKYEHFSMDDIKFDENDFNNVVDFNNAVDRLYFVRALLIREMNHNDFWHQYASANCKNCKNKWLIEYTDRLPEKGRVQIKVVSSTEIC